MSHLTKLFRLLEITRAQPQYGYVLSEIPKGEVSDLAQHHYLVTFIAWRLCRLIQKAGGHIDTTKVLEYALIHDLGELFGGDIAMPYAKANPAAREKAKDLEQENQKFIASFFGEDKQYFKELCLEVMEATTDEALVAKIADYIEVTHYKLYVHRLTKGDVVMGVKKIKEKIGKMSDQRTKKALTKSITAWEKELRHGKVADLFESAKSL